HAVPISFFCSGPAPSHTYPLSLHDALPIFHPTPVVAVLGVIDDVAKRIPSGWQDEGNNIYLLGTTRDELDGSAWAGVLHDHLGGDRKSTRLNSSHVKISYAVFCLKKKKPKT